MKDSTIITIVCLVMIFAWLAQESPIEYIKIIKGVSRERSLKQEDNILELGIKNDYLHGCLERWKEEHVYSDGDNITLPSGPPLDDYNTTLTFPVLENSTEEALPLTTDDQEVEPILHLFGRPM